MDNSEKKPPRYSEVQYCICGMRKISYGWCKICETCRMRLGFTRWSSDNTYVDKLIQQTQLNASQTGDFLEFIEFQQFALIEYVAKGGFGTVYKAYWLNGPRWNWDEEGQEWSRSGPITVALKRLDNSQNINREFVIQVEQHYRCLQSGSLADCFGITRDPTGCFMFVMRFYENGNLYEYIERSKGIISWRDMVDMLWGIAGGLERIHAEKRCHGNLHGGNLLIEDETISTDARIADVGLHGPADRLHGSQIYGVIPFIAPEVFYGQPPNQSSDIYSFGIIMWTLATGRRPWCNRPHDLELVRQICHENLRPTYDGLIVDMPKPYRDLMTKCWDVDPAKRPTAPELSDLLGEWITYICDDPNPSRISEEFSSAEDKRWEQIEKHLTENSFETRIHPEAIYTSRLITFPELI